MGLLYMNEHTSCHHYMTDVKIGFRYIQARKGEQLEGGETTFNFLFFILSGKVSVSCDNYSNEIVDEGEFFFLAKSSYRAGEVLEDSELLVVSFEAITNLCEKLTFKELEPYKKQVKKEFYPLIINQPLKMFLQLMVSYLKDGANCVHLHENKFMELLWVFRAYYSKQDLATLFYPIIGGSLDFRNKVLAHCKRANTALELADLCGYGRHAFARMFVKEFGEQPYAWMQKRLMMYIRMRLTDPDIQLSDVVDEFQLSSLSHLNRLCKKHFGMTPIELHRELVAHSPSATG